MNLIFAIVVVAGYVASGFAFGISIDQCFLTNGPWRLGRGGGPLLPPWTFPAIFDGIILVTFFVCRAAEWNLGAHRVFCGFFGLAALTMIALAHLPHRVIFPEDEAARLVPPWYDVVLALYIWISHLIYALLGPKED